MTTLIRLESIRRPDMRIDERKKRYIKKIYEEMRKRGFTSEEIPKIISRTGFMDALNYCPEEQMLIAVEDAVDEIIVTAARF